MRAYFFSLMTDARGGFVPACLKGILFLFSFVYRLLSDARNALWRFGLLKAEKAPLAVISVGNITVGGTGKTPFVRWLVGYLRREGKTVAVLSRGYGAVRNGLSDEALELKRAFPDLPVFLGRDRVRLARKACAEKMDAVVLDDGFQYRRLARDLDIVLIDATNPFGNGRLLPRGILREDLSALGRADLLVLTRTDGRGAEERLVSLLKTHAPDAPVLLAVHRIRECYEARTGERTALETLKPKRALPFCGIGNPGSFRSLLEEAGLHLLPLRSFMDHHRYTRKEIGGLDRLARSWGADILLTTEKDGERLRALRMWPATPLWVAAADCVVTKHEEELFHRLRRLLSR